MQYTQIIDYLETKGYRTVSSVEGGDGQSSRTCFRTKGAKSLANIECFVVVDYIPKTEKTAYSTSTYFTDKNTKENFIIRDGAFAGVSEVTQKDLDSYIDELEAKVCSYVKDIP